MGFTIIEEIKPGWNKILDDNGQYYLASANYPDPGSARSIFQEPLPIREITPEQLWDRFTDQEQEDISASTAKKVLWFFKMIEIKRGQLISLDNAQLVSAINAAESGGLIGTGRAAEILS